MPSDLTVTITDGLGEIVVLTGSQTKQIAARIVEIIKKDLEERKEPGARR